VYEHEKEYGSEFETDIEMKCDLNFLADTDDLTLTVDYSKVQKLAEQIFNGKKFNLLETLAQNICKGILDNFQQVRSVRVSIRKAKAPIGLIDSVEVITKMKRSSK
jgi:dihydroneopterin aldolase